LCTGAEDSGREEEATGGEKGVSKRTGAAAFQEHMSSFIDHISDQSHAHCNHAPGMGKMRVGAIKHKNTLAELKILIKSYVADIEWFSC
jgi:hypothetical protein